MQPIEQTLFTLTGRGWDPWPCWHFLTVMVCFHHRLWCGSNWPSLTFIHQVVQPKYWDWPKPHFTCTDRSHIGCHANYCGDQGAGFLLFVIVMHAHYVKRKCFNQRTCLLELHKSHNPFSSLCISVASRCLHLQSRNSSPCVRAIWRFMSQQAKCSHLLVCLLTIRLHSFLSINKLPARVRLLSYYSLTLWLGVGKWAITQSLTFTN